MTNEKLIRDQIEELLQKIDSGQGDLKEILKYISEVGELERTLIDAKTRFCKRVLELVPIGNIKGVYRITHTLPLQYEEEYIETLSDGLSFEAAFDKIKNKYNI